ncbi:unnamed protein product [Calypogeia fissa]
MGAFEFELGFVELASSSSISLSFIIGNLGFVFTFINFPLTTVRLGRILHLKMEDLIRGSHPIEVVYAIPCPSVVQFQHSSLNRSISPPSFTKCVAMATSSSAQGTPARPLQPRPSNVVFHPPRGTPASTAQLVNLPDIWRSTIIFQHEECRHLQHEECRPLQQEESHSLPQKACTLLQHQEYQHQSCIMAIVIIWS